MTAGLDPRPTAVLAELELDPCRWDFPAPEAADGHGLVVVGGDLEPETLVSAYCQGLFPMPFGRRRRIGWWSPDPRATIPVDELVVSRSLRRSCKRYEVRVDTAFRDTMTRCGDPRRPNGWINAEFVDAYCRLHDLGIAHSVECWDDRGELVGGLYGVAIRGLFAGESMFHSAPDASKVALVHLCDLLGATAPGSGPSTLLDVQWMTPHLASLGAVELPRPGYLERLRAALAQPFHQFDHGSAGTEHSSADGDRGR